MHESILLSTQENDDWKEIIIIQYIYICTKVIYLSFKYNACMYICMLQLSSLLTENK